MANLNQMSPKGITRGSSFLVSGTRGSPILAAAERPMLSRCLSSTPTAMQRQMTTTGRVLTTLLLVGAAITSCSTVADTLMTRHFSAPDSRPQLDGLYEVQFTPDGATQDGMPLNDPRANRSALWAFRSSCSDRGCVATASVLREKPPAPPVQQMVFDFIDGRWVAVTQPATHTCADGQPPGTTRTADVWSVISLKPTDDENLTGSSETIALDACKGIVHLPVTATRKAATPDGVTVADPNTQPPRVVSSAQALRGRYSMTFSGQPQPTSTWTVSTYCLRSGDRCVTLIHATPSDANGAKPYADELAFADGQWTQTITVKPQPCRSEPGRTSESARRIVTAKLPPPPVPDPLPELTLNHRMETIGGRCAGSVETTSTLNRIGD
jgi:hypothetical protein